MNVQRRIPISETHPVTGASAVALALRHAGVRRVFGVPGGRGGLALIEECRSQGIRFIATRNESAAVIAAGVTGELSGVPGVALVGVGPGTANGLTGLASMALDRSPLLLICDGFDTASSGLARNPMLSHTAILAPLLKAHHSLQDGEPASVVEMLTALAMAAPRGPVMLDLDGAAGLTMAPSTGAGCRPVTFDIPSSAVGTLRARLGAARRPVLVLGMESRDTAVAAAAARLAERLECPVFVTTKGKGVLPDEHASHVGIFTGGISEAPLISKADLVILVGVDPAELTRDTWHYDVPVMEIIPFARTTALVPPGCTVTGPLAAALDALGEVACHSDWTSEIMERHRGAVRAALAYPGRRDSVGPQRVVEMALSCARERGLQPRITVDAGAHMISATTFSSCARPYDLLVSHGLAATGFAIPAAIAAALHEPSRPVIAFVGDGGLAVSMAELATAIAAGVRIVVVVFNDDGPSIIAANRGRAAPSNALDWQHIDFAQVMQGLGGRGAAVRTVDEYGAALDQALEGSGPALIDVRIDPAGYHRQFRAISG